jgi:hypothetical protein
VGVAHDQEASIFVKTDPFDQPAFFDPPDFFDQTINF